jgi:hypothetical protein
MISFEQYARFLQRSAARAEPLIGVALARVGDHALSLATEYVGHELPQWEPLSAGYVAQKRKDGLTGRVSATDPWLRTGETVESFAAVVEGHSAVLGSPLDKAMWNELGTSRAPPRPVLALAMQNATEFAEDVFYEAAVALLVPAGERA